MLRYQICKQLKWCQWRLWTRQFSLRQIHLHRGRQRTQETHLYNWLDHLIKVYHWQQLRRICHRTLFYHQRTILLKIRATWKIIEHCWLRMNLLHCREMLVVQVVLQNWKPPESNFSTSAIGTIGVNWRDHCRMMWHQHTSLLCSLSLIMELSIKSPMLT